MKKEQKEWVEKNYWKLFAVCAAGLVIAVAVVVWLGMAIVRSAG